MQSSIRVASMQPVKSRFASAITPSIVQIALLAGIWHGNARAQVDAPAEAEPPTTQENASRDLVPRQASIPVHGAGVFGGDIDLKTQVFLPPGPGPFPVLVYSHGRSSDLKVRAALRDPIPRAHARYWVARGVAVVAPARIGYGETGGPDVEVAGARYDFTGACIGHPDYKHVSDIIRRPVLATLDWVREQPWADKNRIVLEGTSAGGFASVSTAATRPAGVIAYINFSGGIGGSPTLAPGRSCDPEQMRDLMGEFGKTVSVRGLWLYAGNDQYWGGDAPRTWYKAFAAGGSEVRMVAVPELPGQDGHMLLYRGSALWRKDLDRFANEIGL